ncbi:pyridine nucleotide-disulfide oxidoreductase [Aeromicrobium piscarium]|uniref:Pyridine nucleotide-disulfide oxidoreductase n=1 Tax=Aeromicrobium piscarium TaxID=2590901 RepID=A0A554RME5_9ACTN|nr:pyridine nucleotide-disulfide oxidoreductase [Aeromicrobium piscarium]
MIVGAGQAGHALASTLRRRGYADPITLVGDEEALPYQRPPLSKACLIDDGAVSVALGPAEYYETHDVTVLRGKTVIRVNAGEQRVELCSGEALPYQHLVLATGSVPRKLAIEGVDLDGVHMLRTLEHSSAIREGTQNADRIAVIGAGFIGLEVAAAARQAGTAVTVVEAQTAVMPRVVSQPMAHHFADRHSREGVEFVFEDVAERLVGENGRVVAIETRSGRRIDADVVVIGVGVEPRCELAVQAGLDVDNGVVVDHRLLTSDPHISAIGDCASFPSPWGAGRVRLESVQNAVDQAACVASRLLGDDGPYEAVPWFWTDQYDLKLKIAGDISGHDETIVVETGRPDSFSVYCFADGVFLGAESLNQVPEHMAVRRILKQKTALSADQVRDPEFSPKAHARAEAPA